MSMMAWDTPLMPPNYAVALERRKNLVMHGTLNFERPMRNGMGVFIAYEWVEVTSFERVVLRTRYPDFLTWFDQYEVPADFLAELTPCLVYHGLSMREDPQSSKWMVFLSEWLAIVAKRFIWSTYDGRLYVLPTAVTEWLRCLDLARVLGSAVLQERLQALLDLHERVDWSRVPYNQGHHFDNPGVGNHSPGSTIRRRYPADRKLGPHCGREAEHHSAGVSAGATGADHRG